METSYQKLSLEGRRALVSGASQGIGKAVAFHFSQLGAKLILLARNEENLNKVKQSLVGTGHEILVLDVGNLDQLQKQLQFAVQSDSIDIVVNNSGGPKGGQLLEAKAQDFEIAFRQHVLAAQITLQVCVEGMKKKNYGRVINIISTSVKAPIPNLGVSNTVRGAMANWAKTMATELGPFGITVNNVLPGFTQTGRLDELRKATAIKTGQAEEIVDRQWKSAIPAGRFAAPSELAAAVSFLASPWASYINGINLPVDGGRTPSL